MTFKNRRIILIAVVSASLLAVGSVAYFGGTHGEASGQTRGAALADALPTPGGNLSEAAATVNGRAIPKFQLDTSVALAEGVAKGLALGGNAAPAASRAQILQDLIGAELKYQEALRLGLAASDAEVSAAIEQSRKGLDDPAITAAKEPSQNNQGDGGSSSRGRRA